MKLMEIKAKCQARNKCAIRFNPKGSIWFTSPLVEKLEIQQGQTISFFQDEEKPKDWYIKKGNGQTVVKSKSGSTFVNNSEAVSELVKSLKLDPEKSHSFIVATSPEEYKGEYYYAILTSTLL